jgi:hypothetical protein
MINNANGVELLEDLTKHPNTQISQISENIRQKYFPEEQIEP